MLSADASTLLHAGGALGSWILWIALTLAKALLIRVGGYDTLLQRDRCDPGWLSADGCAKSGHHVAHTSSPGIIEVRNRIVMRLVTRTSAVGKFSRETAVGRSDSRRGADPDGYGTGRSAAPFRSRPPDAAARYADAERAVLVWETTRIVLLRFPPI